MKIVKEFVCREIVGECILVPTGATAQEFNGIINLNETGKFIWERIEKVDSLDLLISLFLDEYEIDEATARKDISDLIDQMLSHGYIAYTDPDKKW